jgi:Domain of unknown function (DUF1772)
MLLLLKFVATFAAALFSGAALYINVVEQPARLTLDTRSAVAQWATSYRRATWLQAPLALLSLLAGLGAWLLGAGRGWALAALLIGAVIPFTLIGIMPTNKALLRPDRDPDTPKTRALLARWAKLHAVRTLLGLAAALWYVYLALSP